MRPYPIMRYIIPPLVRLWIKKVTGTEHIPKDKAFILAPNHSSYIEHLMLGSIILEHLNKRFYALAKKEHFDNFLEVAWHRYIRAIPLDRSKGDDTLRIAVDHLKQGKIIMIYPEGTRTLTGKIQQGKTGAVRLAIWAQVPVVPCGIKGTFDILPKGKTIPRLKRATIHFGKPITFEKYYGKPMTKTLLREGTTTLMKEIARLSDQEYPFD